MCAGRADYVYSLAWARDRGLTVAPEHVFIDDGISGAKLDRLVRKPCIAYRLALRRYTGVRRVPMRRKCREVGRIIRNGWPSGRPPDSTA